MISFEGLSDRSPSAKTYKFGGGRSRKFPENCAVVDLAMFSRSVVFDADDGEYGVVIRIENMAREKKQKKIFYYYFNFTTDSPGKPRHPNEKIALKYVRQKMEYNNQAFEVQEIYGLDTSVNNQANIDDTEKDCVICMSEKIDTIILTCRHMCLCLSCAKSLSKIVEESKKKCPVCRHSNVPPNQTLISYVAIESFLRITKAMKAEAALPNQPAR